jgi:RecB family exonuclease
LKGKSKSTHYFQELESDASLRAGFEVVGVNDVYQQAARAGVSRGGASLGRAGGGGGGEEQAELDEAFDDQFVRARREVRLLAAEAIEAADTPGLTKEQLDGTIDLLRDAAVRMGVIAHAASDSPDPPEWLIAAASNREGAANLARELTDRTAHARGGGVRGLLTPPPKGPLHLSYSQLDAYHRCPRCYYLRYILRLPEAEHDAEVVGSVVHKAIERFTLAALGREAAIADGLFAEPHAPASSRLLAADVQTLIRYGREALIDAGVNPSDPDDDQGMRVELLLRSYFEQFFNPDHHTLEVERAASFAFPAAGLVHTINVKIDRIDQYALPDGAAGFRVIDYKTGKDWKRLTQPAPDDLQLGCYALALESIYGDGDASSPASALRGSAEYWLLAGRQRGVLPLEKIRLDKVRTKISGAIDGMLAGKFEPDKRCERDCRLFEPN